MQGASEGRRHELTSNSPEDPSRNKSWGFISARPSEFLVVYRKGALREDLSGQGARVWKRPSDTVAVVPTTLKEVIFQANQITSDHVDVRIRGMLVYRITDPLRIYALINFSDRQRAEAKLARMLSDMCRSTAKWLVANMALEECSRRRKEEIAAALKREVAAVATEGWGIEIVTIDIQDVYVQDAELFAAMQARFKLEAQRDARMAEQELARRVEIQRLEHERALALERHGLEIERARLEAEAALTRIERDREADEQQFMLDRYRVEQNQALALHEAEQVQRRLQAEAEGALVRARITAEAEQLAADTQAYALRERLAAESGAGRASLERLFLSESLPALATALASSLEGARFNVYQGGGAGPLPFALDQLLELLGQRLKAVPEPQNGTSRIPA